MLISINLRNFKSYREAALPLAPMTILVGPNASGKSNALEAIRLLNWLARGRRLEDIERAISSGKDAVVRGLAKDLFLDPDQPFALGCHLDGESGGMLEFSVEIGQQEEQLVISGEKIVDPAINVPLYQVDGAPNSHTDEIRVAYNNFMRRANKPHIPCSNRQAVFYQLGTPGRFDKGHEKSQKVIPAAANALREALANIVFLDPRPALMRGYEYVKNDVINEDGGNLSAVLYGICQRGAVAKQELLQFIRSLPEQDISDIQFIETERKDVMVRLEETFGAQSRMVDAPLLSDGTLRVLAVAAALLTAPTGALVVVEEIDNGVHPSRAEALVRQIAAVARTRQLRVLMTSHNPALLDALPDAALADVLCCFRDVEHGDSRLVRLGDLARYPELAAQGPLGQLMTRRVLERFLKDDSTPEQRQSAALDWLATLQGGQE